MSMKHAALALAALTLAPLAAQLGEGRPPAFDSCREAQYPRCVVMECHLGLRGR